MICLTVEGDPDRYIVPGSMQDQCADCGALIWVAPSGQKLLKEARAITVCPKCGLTRVREHPGDLEMAPGQIDEIKEWRRRN